MRASESGAELTSILASARKFIADQAGAVRLSPGTVIPDLIEQLGLATDSTITARHGWLHEPRIFDQGTPMLRTDDRLTLLLELVMLTDDRLDIAHNRDLDAVETRLRRRGTNVADLRREGRGRAVALYRKYRSRILCGSSWPRPSYQAMSTTLDSGRINRLLVLWSPAAGKTSSPHPRTLLNNCVEETTSTPCGKCPSCISLAPW